MHGVYLESTEFLSDTEYLARVNLARVILEHASQQGGTDIKR